LFAFEGACGWVTDEYDGCFVSAEFPNFDCDLSRVRPEFLFAYFKDLNVWKQIAAGSKGLGDRRQRVQPDTFLNFRIMLPPIEWQNKLSRVINQANELESLQAETQKELDALMPSILDRAFKGEL
jgi:type I restriction enzyme S subunit